MEILNYNDKTTILDALIFTRMEYWEKIKKIEHKKIKNKLTDEIAIDYYNKKIEEYTVLIDKIY